MLCIYYAVVLICIAFNSEPASFINFAFLCISLQELALYGEFTICETLHYFGRIYAMKKVEIDKQIEFLTTLLDLPKSGILIRRLRYI